MSEEHAKQESLAERTVDRRRFMYGAAAAMAGGMFAPWTFRGVTQAAASTGGARRSLVERAQEMPADAATADKQVLVMPDYTAIAKVLDFMESVYGRPSESAFDLTSEPLVRIDKNFQIQPASAESWSSSEDGMTWTFKIRQGLMWSDGNPVTANDWVATFQYAANPEHAWDFTWFYQGVIKNWTQAISGEVPVDQIGFRLGANDYELVVESEVPAPYIPAMMLYSNTLSKAGLAAGTGGLYNTDPETAISAGPYILGEWQKDQQITWIKNEKYTGSLKCPVNKAIVKLATPDTFFQMYQNDEIDYMQNPDPASLTLMMSDDATKSQIYSGVGDFPTWYIFFDVTLAPWTDLRVRQAWSHAIDRDTLKAQVLGPAGTPAYSWLAPGFPASQREAMQSIQAYDPDKAKQLLADAGFPDGKDFPKQELWLRAPSPLDKTVAAALASMIKSVLNIDVELLEKDAQGFTAALNAKPTQIPLGYVRYGMDYLDPSNMLSVWKSGGRHSWSNADFDKGLADASAYLGDPAERIKMFQAVERILVEDVPGVFIYHGTPVQFIKPWLKGPFIAPDDNGITSLHWPGFTTMCTVPEDLYIGSDAPDRG